MQTSPLVQALLSLHAAVLFVCVHAILASQASLVQALPSSQFGAAPPLHTPPLQTSPTVQALPSSQELVELTCVQPSLLSHVSVVQALPSSQLVAPPDLHTPPLQTSPVVQALASSQARLLAACKQPALTSQVSVVQGFVSSQPSATPGLQTPPPQVSPVVHALPSSQADALLVWAQPVLALQESLVHGFESSQFRAPVPAQTLAWQVSPVVHGLPSSQLPT